MKVYLDIFFLVNTGMDFVVLMMESFFQKKKIRLWRLFLAAMAGAGVSTGFLIFGVRRYVWLMLLLYLVGSIGILWIAFGRTTAGAFIRNLVFFYIAAFLLAGILMQMQSVLGIRGSSFFLLTGSAVTLAAARRMIPAGRRWREKTEQYYPVSVFYGGKSVHGNALLDTGNHLTEPFSRRPVTIGEKKFIEPLFAGEERPVVRYIPFRSVGKKSGMLPAFQAEYIEIKGQGGVRCREKKPWIAVCENDVSVDGEYELILHPDMLINL